MDGDGAGCASALLEATAGRHKVAAEIEQIDREQQLAMLGLSSRCGCRCECTTTTHGDVVRSNRNRNNNDAPVAVLEGLAMAGLVAILRQLGDLAELAAEVFDDMQGQVMAASARARRLAVRAKRLLEADLDLPPPSSTHSSAAALTITSPRGAGEGGTPPMPRLVVQRIRRCRGPPRLSLLDKFDAAGEGACLKRYTDPSFFFRAHSAKLLEQGGTLRVRANRGPYLLKSMSTMENRPKFQTAFNNSEPPESAHTVTDCKSESETETDASEATSPGPGFPSSMLRHRQAAGAGSLFRMQQTVDRVHSSPQLNMEKKLQGGGTAQPSPSPSPSPSELERTSSFEAWLAPDGCRFTTTTAHHHEHDEMITQPSPNPHPHPHLHGASSATTTSTCNGFVSHVVTTSNADAALSSSTMLKANKVKGASNKSRSRYKGSVEMIASRVSSLPRKLFSNIKHHNGSDPAGLGISQATGIGDCGPELEAIPTPRETFLPILLHHSDPVYSSAHNLLPLPENDKCSTHLSISCNVSVDAERHHQQEHPSSDQSSNSNSNSSTPETCTTPDSKNLMLPGSLVMKRAGALPPKNSYSGDSKVDTAPPLPPIPPMQWLPDRVHTGTRATSPKHRALWKKSLEVTEMIQAIRQAHSHIIQTSPVDLEEMLVSNENTSANVSHRDEMKCSESEETRHPQPFRVSEDAVQASSEGIVFKVGEFPVPAVLSDDARSEIDLRTQAQADTCSQQQRRQQFCSSGHSDEKRRGVHEASDDTSNLQNESVFFSAVQELAKMSPPPSVPRPKYSLIDSGSHVSFQKKDSGSHVRITLRNGPSLIHPSRNILDSRSVLIKQIKDIAMAGNPSFKLKPVSGPSSPQSPVTGSPTNPKVATILQRADEIRQAHADSKDVNSEESWSDDSE